MQTGRGKPWQGRSKPCVLALAAAVLGLLLSVAHTAGLLWPKRPPTFASALDSRPLGSGRLHAGWHARADMHCIPNGVEWTACLIKDLYYDTRERGFLFFGRQFGEASVSAVDTDLQALFAEQIAFLDKTNATSEIIMRWSPEPRPRAQDTCVVTVPIHLRQEYEIGTASFGHLLRDNYTPLVTIASQFGFSAAAFSWVSWPRATGRRKDTLAHVQEKYNGWISAHRAYKWGGFTAACMAGQLGGGASGSLPSSKPRRYVHIELALASGTGDVPWIRDGMLTKACERARFAEQRDLAYALNDVPLVPVALQRSTLVTILYKAPADKRRMLVGSDVLRAMQSRFPSVEFKLHDGEAEDADVQLQWLGRTSIFIANVGSPSFRMIYLPDGAQVILVGPLDTAATGTDGEAHYAEGWNFFESRCCWDLLPYIKVHEYHVTDVADIEFQKNMRKGPPGDKSGRNWEAVRIRDAHVRLRAQTLLPLLERAMGEVQKQRMGAGG